MKLFKNKTEKSSPVAGPPLTPGAPSPTGVLSPMAPRAPRRRRGGGKQAAVVVAAIIVAVAFIVHRNRVAETPHDEVHTAQVARGDVVQTVSATGTLQPFSEVDVKSRAGGTVLKMAVEEGTIVKKGQLIALIDTQDTTAAYKQAEADLTSAKATLAQAKENEQLQNASIGPQIQQSAEGVSSAQSKLTQSQQDLAIEKKSVGPAVRQSTEALDTTRTRLQQAQDALTLQKQTSASDIASAQGTVAAAQAHLDQAIAQAQAQPALSQSAINQAQAGVDAANANLQSAQQTLHQLTVATFPQERSSAQAAVDGAKSDVDTAQANLNRYKQLLAKGFIAQNQVDAAQNQLVTAQSSLHTAQSHLDTLKDDESARQQDAQAHVDAAQGSLQQAKAALASANTNAVQDSLKQKDVTAARATLKQAQAALNSSLANKRNIAVKASDVTAAQSAVRSAAAALTVSQANTGQVAVKAGDVSTAQSALRQAQAALQGAQANTIQSGIKGQQVIAAQAALTRAQVTATNALQNLQQTRVVAPRDGIVLQKYVDVGTIIQSGTSGFSGGTAIVQLADVDQMYVDTEVDEADIALIDKGQHVDITLDAYPDSPKEGTVRKIYPTAVTDQNVTYIHVQVAIDAADVDARLRPAMNATCDFNVAEKDNALEVPSEAVKDDENGSTVTVIKDPKKPLWLDSNQSTVPVEVGVRGDDNTEITSGLKLGQTVVTQVIPPITDSSSTAGTSSLMGARGGGGGHGGGRH